MTDDVVIQAVGLGKKYLIGHNAKPGSRATFGDLLSRSYRTLRRRTADLLKGRGIIAGSTVEEFWALKDVTFDVRRGDVLGILGRNGAGKSTLLKILSRITDPTEGRVTIKGRVASLLEVGTGFHPELSGRQNIYLNGAILGMTRAETRRKFDQIVEFAEVEKFLDTPVKHYSSGMYVRLAFAVAAHLEPDILIVDEVLSVGDVEFQRKCLGKISDVSTSGRTVLFVSHSLDAVRRIGKTGILLSAGRITFNGTIEECSDAYIGGMLHDRLDHIVLFPTVSGDRPHLRRIEVLDRNAHPLPNPGTNDYVRFRIFFYTGAAMRSIAVTLYISSRDGQRLIACATAPSGGLSISTSPGESFVDCDFPVLPLSGGSFIIGAGLAIPNVEWLDNHPYRGILHVGARDVFGSGLAPLATHAPIVGEHIWHVPDSDKFLSVPGGRSGRADQEKTRRGL
jgi:lipopolysaccharide transport system ATP-binding protein